MPVAGATRFEHFFRVAAGLDVDKNDVKRYEEFLREKLADLLIAAEARAKADGRDVIGPSDLPITKGLQERIHEYRKLEQQDDFDFASILESLTTIPQLDLAVAAETEERLPRVAGGVSVALGQSFRIIDTKLVNPSSEHWERAFRLFDLLL
jgi:hypothetical protein